MICYNLDSKKHVKSAPDIFCIILIQFHVVQPHQSKLTLVFSKSFLPLPFISQKRKTSDMHVRKCLILTQIWHHSQSVICGCGLVQDLYPESNPQTPRDVATCIVCSKMCHVSPLLDNQKNLFCYLFTSRSYAIAGQLQGNQLAVC